MKLFNLLRKNSGERTDNEPLADIVIIDDTPENLHLLNDVLSKEGYKVRPLPSGKMGINACQTAAPDLVLLDITMPEMDGFEVATHLKADRRTKDIPIIFISAMNSTEDKVKAFKSGGVDYVTKPIQVEEVIARVETHLAISRMRSQINEANEKLLTWNIEMQQKGKKPRISGSIRSLFGDEKVSPGAHKECNVTVVAVASNGEHTAAITEKFESQLDASRLGQIGVVTVFVVDSNEGDVTQWVNENMDETSLKYSAIAGAGALLINDDFQLSYDGSNLYKAVAEVCREIV